ncbi:kinase-like domain-containing protein [Fimicolochytrium jonesii]|uniref:kinase-like domain-containing protein n=1 Tax=Fimicolochytrium jonesii TaxID=1396493 RepID=UPI0022FF3635|nr:kinase-like domain-containing protein [Fimicolochytrium jonesii]KAI8821857.1 kinase-like domain-containing protein [Fimicolochytrium jonesii]
MSVHPETSHDRKASAKSKSSHHRRGSTASSLSGIFHNRKSLERTHFTNEIGDYELISDIGGVDDISYLYQARHIPTGDPVALKYTDLTISPDYELIEELIRTVKNTNQCHHRNILPYWTTFVENERMWNVTCPMQAGSFRNIMRNHFQEGFSEPVVATILRELLKAIVYMHDNMLIHNDIRADNILLVEHGEIKITGLRQMISLSEGGQYLESVFSIVGDNIEWAAPEVMAQNSVYDEKADIYSIGITALELAFNRTPFDDWPPLKVLLSKLEYPCPLIPTKKAMSKEFYDMVYACLHKDPKRRPSACELADNAFFKQAKSTKFLEAQVLQKLESKPRTGPAVSPEQGPSPPLPVEDTTPSNHRLDVEEPLDEEPDE